MTRKISLVVATRDRPTDLERLIASLTRVGYENLEVIVVDQSAQINSSENERIISSSAISSKVIHLKTDTRGLSCARNLGIKYVTGEIIGFPDDDCWYQFGCLSMVAGVFDENPKFDFLSGLYTEPGRINLNFPKTRLEINNLRSAMVPSSITLFLRASVVVKSLLKFDERLGAGSRLGMLIGEETHLIRRMVIHGLRGLYDPNIVFFHKICNKRTSNRASELSWGYIHASDLKDRRALVHAIFSFCKLIYHVLRGVKPPSSIIWRIRGYLKFFRLGIDY